MGPTRVPRLSHSFDMISYEVGALAKSTALGRFLLHPKNFSATSLLAEAPQEGEFHQNKYETVG